jgi:uracil-DNA glycosylase
VKACMPWLRAEVREVKPEVIVCLGATAAQALIGKAFRVTKQRGELLPFPLAPAIMATWHPSAILRAPDDAARRQQTAELVEDLRRAAAWLQQHRRVA